MDKKVLDSLIQRIMGSSSSKTSYFSSSSNQIKITANEVLNLCKSIEPVFEKEKIVLDISGPINICGDLHGNLSDLLLCFQRGGSPPSVKWLFLGDYVDRGEYSIEVITLLFSLKIKYPNHIYLIRGNHECVELTESFGFANDCLQRYEAQGEKIWTAFCDTFEYMPIAAIVANTSLCIHGGISPSLQNIQQIRDIKRPLKIPLTGLIADLFWSDPSKETEEYGKSDRGTTCVYGLNPIKRFLSQNNLKHIIRAHQMVADGFELPFSPDDSVITIFTSSNYEEDIPNKAAFLKVGANGGYEVFRLQ